MRDYIICVSEAENNRIVVVIRELMGMEEETEICVLMSENE